MSRDRERQSAFLEELGTRLSDTSDRYLDRSWQRFLRSDPKAAAQAAELEVLTTEPGDAPISSGAPGASGPARSQFWNLCGSRRALDLSMDLWSRWIEHDPRVLERVVPWGGYSREEFDDTSYLLFLHRLPSPAENLALTRGIAMEQAEAWLSPESGERSVEALDAVGDPATDERWLVLVRHSLGSEQVVLIEYGHLACADLDPERFDEKAAQLSALGYPDAPRAESEGGDP